MTTTPAQHPLAASPTGEDEIDMRQVAGALSRRWRWIVGGGAIGVLFSGLSLLNTKPVYQGEFQIVLDQGNSKSAAAAFLSQNPALSAIAGLGAMEAAIQSPPRCKSSTAPLCSALSSMP